jgi:integrase
MISFHTARRSCITNLYKRGYPVNYIMMLSGYRSVQAFQRYMRASNKELMDSFMKLLKKDRAL